MIANLISDNIMAKTQKDVIQMVTTMDNNAAALGMNFVWAWCGVDRYSALLYKPDKN